MSSQAPRSWKGVCSPIGGATKPSCGDVNGAACELPGMAYPRCKAKCWRGVGHPGKCWCSFHERCPWDLCLPLSGGSIPVKIEPLDDPVTPKDEMTKNSDSGTNML